MPKHIETGAGAPITAPDAIGQHYIDTNLSHHFAAAGTSSSNDWKITQSNVPIPLFDGNTNPYLERTATSWTRISDIFFQGTTEGHLVTEFYCIASETGSGGNGRIRIYDVTNGKVIAKIITISGATMAIYEDDTITNLPTGNAIFEIQLKHDDAGGTVFVSNVYIEG